MAQNVRARSVEEENEGHLEVGPGIPRTLTPEEEFRAQLEQLQWNARQEYLRAGDSPLDWEGLEREIAERRGGVRDEDEDLVR